MCDPVLILCQRRRLSVCKSNELCWTHTDTTVREERALKREENCCVLCQCECHEGDKKLSRLLLREFPGVVREQHS